MKTEEVGCKKLELTLAPTYLIDLAYHAFNLRVPASLGVLLCLMAEVSLSPHMGGVESPR